MLGNHSGPEVPNFPTPQDGGLSNARVGELQAQVAELNRTMNRYRPNRIISRDGRVHTVLSLLEGNDGDSLLPPFTVDTFQEEGQWRASMEPGVVFATYEDEEQITVTPEFQGEELLMRWEWSDDYEQPSFEVTDNDKIWFVTEWFDKGDGLLQELVFAEFIIQPDEPDIEDALVRELGFFERIGNILRFFNKWTGHRDLVREGIDVSSMSSSSSLSNSLFESDSEVSSLSKSTAIVKTPFNPDGCSALYIVESAQPRFDDCVTITNFAHRIDSRKGSFPIDPHWLYTVEPNTVQVVGFSQDRYGRATGLYVDGDRLFYKTSLFPFFRPKTIVIWLSGIQKGQAGVRLDNRTDEQRIQNQKWINSAYEQ